MQGQRSAINSLPDSINFDYGSPTSNVGVDQQIFWNSFRNPAESRLSDCRIPSIHTNTLMGSVSHEVQNFSVWNLGESSSANAQNLVSYDEGLNQSGLPAATNGSVGASLRLEEQQYEPTNLVSHSGVNLCLSSNPAIAGPSFVRSSDMNSVSPSFDLSDGNFYIDGSDMNFLNASKPIGFEGKFPSSASSSSDPFASSRGSDSFVVEEDESRAGCSLDGHRLSCKRKTLEGNAGQSSGGSCFSRAESGIWHTVPPRHGSHESVNVSILSESSPSTDPPEQVNPRLGLGMGGGVPSDSIRPLSVPGEPESSQRNNRLSVNPSTQQDTVSNSAFPPASSAVDHRPDIPVVHQPLRFMPISPPLDLMSQAIHSDNSIPSNPPVIMRVPALHRHVQAHRWNGAPNLSSGRSSSNAVSGGRDAMMSEDLNSSRVSRNIADHPMFVPLGETRSSAQNLTNWSLSSGNVGIVRNIPSSSRTGSASVSHTTPGPSWAPHRHPPSQNSRRLSEYVRRSLLSTPVGSEIVGQNSSNTQHRSGTASGQDGTLTSSDGSQGRSQSQSRSALWIERQGEAAAGIPYSLRALAAAGEGRSRLVSELRNVLEIMRRGEGLRLEDVMLLDRSVLMGMADAHDQHQDMRLDVDSMSYEELLALEERIGNVCTGLSEETISRRLKLQKFLHAMSDDQIGAEPCCICQEEYRDEDGVGTLDCGHDFHSECIKKWLAHKNLCPICKTTALAT